MNERKEIINETLKSLGKIKWFDIRNLIGSGKLNLNDLILDNGELVLYKDDRSFPVCVQDCRMSSGAFWNQFIPLLKVKWKDFTYMLSFVLETPLKMFRYGLSKECLFSQLLM